MYLVVVVDAVLMAVVDREHKKKLVLLAVQVKEEIQY